tara:strand:+ start:29 stop:880 length:852 start_codon:yes stop_codon:yes gene_type:complete
MAKKKKETIEEPIVEKTVVVEEPIVETPKVRTKPQIQKKKSPEDNWEMKDRIYRLKGGKSPLSYIIKNSNIFYFDEEAGYERELQYTLNQRTPFVDEFKGDARLAHIIFRDGILAVPKNKQTLQKLLSLYHPLKDRLYEEVDEVVKAENQLDVMELEIEALMIAKDLDIDMMEAIMRVEVGSKVSEMSSKELKRDCLVFAKKNPALFIELVSDENIELRNFGIKAVELGFINISQDQRTFTWASNDRKLMTVPFDEHPYTALAHWFKTDEGMEIYANLEKRMK